MKKYFLLFLLVTLSLTVIMSGCLKTAVPTVPSESPTDQSEEIKDISQLNASPTSVSSGKTITVTFSGAPGNQKDFIALYQVGVPNGPPYVSYKLLNGQKSGTLYFTAPSTAGDYEFRMFKNNTWVYLGKSNPVTVNGYAPLTPGGMAYMWYYWPQFPVNGFYNFDVLLTIDVDPGVQSAYYWAHQFGFKNGDGGYMGLQTNGYMQGEWVGKMAIFSIWEALEAEPGPGASSEGFTGEGEGWSCRIKYNWVEGHTYVLRIWVLGVDEQENEWWGAWIIDTSTSQETYIGKIKVPASWKWLDDSSVVWVEYYGQVNDCASIPYAKARFEQPTADNGSFMPPKLTSIIGTTCTNAQITLLENQGVTFETGGLVLY